MASETPDRSDRGAPHPCGGSHEPPKLRLVVPGAQQFEERSVGEDGRRQTTRVAEVDLDSRAMPIPRPAAPGTQAEQESRAWIARLQCSGPERDAALVELHALLLRAARFEVHRRAGAGNLRGGDYDDRA